MLEVAICGGDSFKNYVAIIGSNLIIYETEIKCGLVCFNSCISFQNGMSFNILPHSHATIIFMLQGDYDRAVMS